MENGIVENVSKRTIIDYSFGIVFWTIRGLFATVFLAAIFTKFIDESINLPLILLIIGICFAIFGSLFYKFKNPKTTLGITLFATSCVFHVMMLVSTPIILFFIALSGGM